VDPSNIGRNFSGSFRNNLGYFKKFPEKKVKAAEIWGKSAGFFFLGVVINN
jgi:hypothetical protein